MMIYHVHQKTKCPLPLQALCSTCCGGDESNSWLGVFLWNKLTPDSIYCSFLYIIIIVTNTEFSSGMIIYRLQKSAHLSLSWTLSMLELSCYVPRLLSLWKITSRLYLMWTGWLKLIHRLKYIGTFMHGWRHSWYAFLLEGILLTHFVIVSCISFTSNAESSDIKKNQIHKLRNRPLPKF